MDRLGKLGNASVVLGLVPCAYAVYYRFTHSFNSTVTAYIALGVFLMMAGMTLLLLDKKQEWRAFSKNRKALGIFFVAMGWVGFLGILFAAFYLS